MAKKIIVLESAPDDRKFKLAYWLDVPAARQRFYSGGVSQYPDATQAEKDALTSGAVVEEVGEISFDATVTLPQMMVAAQAEWQARQDALNARNPWARFGTYWDGVAWTGAGVS